MEHSLLNFAPVLRLMLLGVLIAMVPLAWVWLRNPNAPSALRLRTLVALTLFLTFDLVLFGAFTRLSDSGLGCPDWPGCYGQASPLGAQAQIAIEQAMMPSGPVTHTKAWIEMVHRYLASSVGVLLIVITLFVWIEKRKTPFDTLISPWWPTLTLLWVCIQGAFGALTVTMKLFPAIVTMHLLGGMVLLALLQAQLSRLRSPQHATMGDTRSLWRWLLLGSATLWLQIALGGWVSTNYAVLVCTEFPACQGQWIPDMKLSEGFEIWRHLGQTGAGAAISLPALTAIHVVHRMFALVVFGVLGVAAFKAWRRPALRRFGQGLAALLALQLATGLSNVVLGWPLLAALAHTGGGAAMVMLTTALIVHLKVSAPAAMQQSSTHLLAETPESGLMYHHQGAAP